MKRGFTLIELLAVIVILAIIALIATPIVLSIIEDTKESATLRSAEFYLNVVEQSIMKKNMNAGGSFSPNTCIVQSDGNLLCDEKDILEVEVSGEVPSSGTITFEKGKIINVELMQSNKTITKNEKGELVLGELQEEIKLASGLYDDNEALIISWEELVEEYDMKNAIEIGIGPDYYDNSAGAVIDSIEGASKLVIDESVTAIGYSAFSGCTNLKSIIIPNSVTYIGFAAFMSCINLKSITIPDSVKSLDEEVFHSCESLESITIPDGIKSIPTSTCFGCSKLESVTIPVSVTSISSGAFSWSNLSTINYKGTETQWSAISKEEVWDYMTPSSKVIHYNYTG